MADPTHDHPPADLPYREPSSLDGSPVTGGHADLLRRVLDQSIEQWLEDQDPIPVHLEELLRVAKLHKTKTFTLDPVAIDLVEAILARSLGKRRWEPNQWRSISSRVARTLVDDRASLERLTRLWERLQQEIL